MMKILAVLLILFATLVGDACAGCVGDTTGIVYGCGDTIIESCTFDDDLTCGSGCGLVIGTDGVVIDGDGYRMIGTATPADCKWCSESMPCTVSGIYDEGYDDVMIKNLEIAGFCTGVSLKGAGQDRVRNVTITNCRIHDNGFDTAEGATHGIHACRIAGSYDEPALVITNNKIYNNEGTGGGCGDGGNGIFIYAGGMGDMHEYCVISHNNIYGNAKAGFWTKMQLSGSTIAHNEIWGNGNGAGITDDVRGGIVLRCKKSSDNTIAHNNVSNNAGSGNSGYGIFVGGRGNLVSDNRANENTGDGIRMGRSDGSSDNRIEGNTVCENDRYGVYAAGGTKNNTLHNNVIHGNGQKDIYDQSGGLAGDENTCDTAYQYHDQTAGNPPPCTYQGPGYGPDLEVTELTPSWTVSGVNYTIDYQVCNSGRGVIANAGETGVYINDALVTSDSVPELGPGQCHSETLGPFPITTGSGIDAIRLCADYTGNETRDHEKANNNLTDVFGGPDLVITEFRHEWIDQERYNLEYTVENIGDLPTPSACWTNFTELNRDWQGRVDHAPIQAGLDVGESVTHIVGPFVMEGDSDWLEAWVNFNHTFCENVEDDLHGNRARFTLASQPHPPSEKGDINGDGKVTPADAAIVLRMAVSGECSEEADVSGDHKVTSLDALMILQLAAA